MLKKVSTEKALSVTLHTSAIVRKDSEGRINGSYRLQCGYQQLIDSLGNPTIIGSGDDKVQLEWVFSDGDKVLTIYDWKTYAPIRDIVSWHIGGKSIDIDSIVAFLRTRGLELSIY